MGYRRELVADADPQSNVGLTNDGNFAAWTESARSWEDEARSMYELAIKPYGFSVRERLISIIGSDAWPIAPYLMA